MRKVFLVVFLLPLTILFAYSQSDARKPIDLVTDAKKMAQPFQGVNLFKIHPNAQTEKINIDQDIERFDLLEVDFDRLQSLEKARPNTFSLALPLNFVNALTLELVKVDILASDFSVVQRSDNKTVKTSTGVHYRGIIKGDEQSIVAISIYEKEVVGLISSNAGNIVLGKLQGQSAAGIHIAYDDLNVFVRRPFSCGTEDSGISYKRKDLELKDNIETRAVGDCVRLYMEVDHDIHNDKGGVAGATNYVTGLMNQVLMLYANESIQAVVSQIVVWDVPSPYSSTSSSGMLNAFGANTNSINGDLGQLLSYQASGGIAYVNGLCRSNVDYRLSFSSIGSSYASVPTYSWSVMVITHEFGHLWGSQHTHACVWNGNGTAIDGCAGSTEGECALPGNPAQGGTIMSYCHLQNVGINFNLGFGTQPGNVIRNSVLNAACLSSCGPPTCEDGIQNGDETGVDCGGSNCPVCPTCEDGIQNGSETGVDCGGSDCAPCACDGTNVTLTITLDNYPEETRWEIKSGNSVVVSGGPYGSQPDGSTISESICLEDGCYAFIIYDAYGDGICCSFGVGNYTLINNSTDVILASGGSFSSVESTNFCVENGQGPTCSDGIQNGQETGVDCGGPDCPSCPCGVPSGLSANPSDNSAALTWNAAVGANNFNVRARMTGTTNWSVGTNLNSPVNFTGLSACTEYEFQVQSNCNGTASAWSASFVFTTTGCVVATCEDGIQNGQETGIDCGGPDCPDCPVDPTCEDGIQNGQETGVDCGGPDCPDCPTCSDGIQNGQETGVDCGGPDCPDCPTCSDGIQNGQETGVDCGGPDCPDCPTCSDGIQNGQETGVDCGGPDCPDCPTCSDGIQNGQETGVDCGGPDCPDCPTCSDGIQNGQETGVDCGGPDCPDCPADPTCDDGIQNGQETGIDCGGPVCVPCTCDNDLTLTIKLDNFPEETSWEIKKGNTVVASGGPYNNQPDGSTVTEAICLADGCYDFFFYDSYGDGICCTYGQGYYTLTDLSDGAILATGGSFNSVVTSNFCLGEIIPTCEDGLQNGEETGIDCGGPDCPDCPTGPTCGDGIQNGEETGIDCGGPDCPDCPPTNCEYEQINFSNFNNAWGIWNDGGSDCRRSPLDAEYAVGGTGSPVRLRDDSNTSHMTTDNLDLSGFDEIKVNFTYLAMSMDNPTEGFWLQISTDGGNNFTTVDEWYEGNEFENGIFYNDEVIISGPFTSNTRLRFQCDASSNTDYVYLDDVTISGCMPTESLASPEQASLKLATTTLVLPEQLRLFPNPVNDELNINFELPNKADVQMVIMDLQGKKMEQVPFIQVQGRIETTVAVRSYPAGIYIVHLITPSGRLSEKFVVFK
ncbi:MAG: M12 family metallo-peptidase [Saprospiraceae bacterium]